MLHIKCDKKPSQVIWEKSTALPAPRLHINEIEKQD